MNADKATNFFANHPYRRIGYGKYSLILFDFPLGDILIEPAGRFVGDIDYFLLSSRFCVSEDKLSVFHKN
jgi:hypothetical protein